MMKQIYTPKMTLAEIVVELIWIINGLVPVGEIEIQRQLKQLLDEINNWGKEV